MKPGFRHTADLYAVGGLGERLDCSVRAVAVAAGLPYDTVHRLFAQAGRQSCHTTRVSITEHAMVLADLRPVKVVQDVRGAWQWQQRGDGSGRCTRTRTGPTLGRFVADHPAGRYVVRVNGHLLAVVEGVVHDWHARPRRRVLTAWRVGAPRQLDET